MVDSEEKFALTLQPMQPSRISLFILAKKKWSKNQLHYGLVSKQSKVDTLI